MDTGQLKRINLNDEADMKFFVEILNNSEIVFGPAGISELLTDAFLSEDENVSVISWFVIIVFLTRFNDQFEGNQKTFMTNVRVKSYLSLIKEIFKLFKDQNLILPHFKNNLMWARKIMNEITPQVKTRIYAIDLYLSKQLANYNYASLEKSLENEGLKVKTMVSAYYAFMTCS